MRARFISQEKRMKTHVTPDTIQQLLEKLHRHIPQETCWTCECLQGFLTQLEVDAGEESAALVGPYKVERAAIHKCLGCELCPSGRLHVEHLQSRR
jgi:hypothetical protein